jgi:hypothetical protein
MVNGQVLKYYAKVEDENGNSVCSSTGAVDKFVTYALDTTAPVVTIASPAAIHSSNQTAYTLSGTCTENGEDVSVSVGGLSPTTAPTCTSSTWSIVESDNFDVNTLSDGIISITVTQSDLATNLATATATTTKDTQAIDLAVTAPVSTKVNLSNYKSFALSGTCGVIGRAVEITAGSDTVLTPAPTSVLCGPGGTWIAYLNFTGSNEGTIGVNVNHSDSYGNGAIEQTQSLTYDVTAPSIPAVVLSSPTSSPGNDSTPTIQVTSAGDVYEAEDKITLHLVSGCVDDAVSAEAPGTGAVFETVTVADEMVNGQVLKYYAKVEDENGNSVCSSTGSVDKFVTYALDTTAPVVTIASPVAIHASNQSAYTLNGTCTTGDEAVNVTLDDSNSSIAPVVKTDIECNSGLWEIVALDVFNVSTLVDSSITITVTQSDLATNLATATATTTKDTAILVSLDDSDDPVGFGGGTKSSVEWSTSTARLTLSPGKSSGMFTSRIMDYKRVHEWVGLEWKTPLPFGKELPTSSELSSDYSEVQADLMYNLVGVWHLNDELGTNLLVESKNAKDLTLDGDVFLGENGKFSKSARFYDGYLSFQDNATGNLNTLVPLNFTIQAWVKPDYASTLSGTNNRIILKHKSNSGISYYLNLEDGKPVFRIFSGGVSADVVSSSKLPYGKWAYVVVSYDGTDMKLFVNGVEKDTAALMGAVVDVDASGGTFYVGGDDTNTNNFAGYIDEVAVWSEAFDETKVKQLYRRGVNRIKFQVRGCYNSSCLGSAWVGPDGTSTSYFSELINNSEIDATSLDPLGDIQSGFPVFTFADYLDAGLSTLNTQYIQYRALFETDDMNFSPELKSVEIKQ